MSAPRPKLAVLSFSHLSRDARVLRQVRCLAADCTLDVLGYGEIDARLLLGARFHALPEPTFWRRNLTAVPKLALGRVLPSLGYERWYWDRPDHQAALARLEALRPDLIIANDWDALPAAARGAERTGARLVLDLHEYSPRQFDNRRLWMSLIAPMIDDALRRYGGRVSQFMTVNGTIADRYAREYGFDCSVVMNVPDSNVTPAFRAVDPRRVRLVHHGLPTRDRKLEQMIEALGRAGDRYELTFMLLDGDRRYIDRLRSLAERRAPGRVHFKPAVAPSEIVQTIAEHDIGFYVLPPLSYNQQAALPNKFFDFLSAGLAVCI